MDKANNNHKNTVIFVTITFISKFVVFFRESILAAKLGATYITDIYVFSSGITMMLFESIGIALSTVFIPTLMDYVSKNDLKKRNKFANNIINCVIVISIMLTIFSMIFTKEIVLLFAPGFFYKYPTGVLNIAIATMRFMLVSLIFISVQNVFTGILQTHKRFTIPSLTTIVSSMVLIIYLLIFNTKYGIIGLTMAVVIGYFIQLLMHIPIYIRLGYKYEFYINLKDNAMKKVAFLLVPVLIGSSVSQISFLVDRMFASLVSEGALSIMNYATKLNFLAYSIFGYAISTVIYPNLSSYYSSNNVQAFKKSLIRGINFVNVIMMPATLGMIVLRYPIIQLVYKHGIFDDKAMNSTAMAMVFYSPGMIAYGIRDILNKAYYSIKDTKTPMIYSVIGVCVNIVLNFLLVSKMGINGLALATSVSAIITTILLLTNIISKLDGNIKTIVIEIIKTSIASILMAIVVSLIYKHSYIFVNNNIVLELCFLCLYTIVGIVIYVVLLKCLKVDEYFYIETLVKSKINILYAKFNANT